MSDIGRQSMTDNIKSTMKPDSQKGITEQATDKMDSMAGKIIPGSMKSDSQKVGDKVTGRDGDDSMLNKAKNAVGMGSNNNQSGGNN